MSIIDQNDLILLCENQFWVRARVIVDTESIRSLAFDIHFLRLFDNKPEICLFQKILNASNQKTITSWYKNYSWKKVGTRYYQVGVQKDPPLVLKGLDGAANDETLYPLMKGANKTRQDKTTAYLLAVACNILQKKL